MWPSLQLFLPLVLFANTAHNQVLLRSQQKNHQAQDLSNKDVQFLSDLSNTNHINEILDNILIPRVVGTPNHEKVYNYIRNELENLHWTITVDEFQESTPNFGYLTFKNIIATLNPNAERFLVLACHYDSKYFARDEFVGATDSAVPCAMMMNLAKQMKTELANSNNNEVSLKLIFFDGEEAFREWGPNDSIYGAKHLARVYDNSRQLSRSTGERVSELQQIDVLVLLDLIGHSGTSFNSYFKNTEKWYLRMVQAEQRLRKLGLIKKGGSQVYFQPRAGYGRIEDDHLPFIAKDVPVVHLISTPFPREWHTPGDNRDIINMKTVEDINKILRLFVAEYLHLFIEDDENTLPEKEL